MKTETLKKKKPATEILTRRRKLRALRLAGAVVAGPLAWIPAAPLSLAA